MELGIKGAVLDGQGKPLGGGAICGELGELALWISKG